MPTPVFLKRIKEARAHPEATAVAASMKQYDQLLSLCDEQGVLKLPKVTKQSEQARKRKLTSSKPSVASLTAALEVKTSTINNLQSRLSSAKKQSSVQGVNPITHQLALDKIKEQEEEIKRLESHIVGGNIKRSKLQSDLDLASEKQATAVARAEVRVMQQFMQPPNFLSPKESQGSHAE